jgi:hypothetical protein
MKMAFKTLIISELQAFEQLEATQACRLVETNFSITFFLDF